jgi:predicted HicB family RNase H-like nuclease
MMNMMVTDGMKAVITYDSEIKMFRGEFVGLNGGAGLYAADVEGLEREGGVSLKVFLDMCKEDGVAALKQFSGKFNVRISRASRIPCSRGRSLWNEPEPVG